MTATVDRSRPFQVVDGVARLVAGVCRACETPMFPLRERCPACASSEVEETLLPEHGTLWTWTTQGFEPKSPPYLPAGAFVPFAVGYLEFDGYLRVEGRLTESKPERLHIGMPMRVVAVNHAGIVTYAFAPDEDTP